MNRAARQQIETADGLHSEKNRLVPTDCTARDAFKEALKTVAPSQGWQPISPKVIPLPAKDKPGLIAIVFPLDSSELKSVCGTVTATVAVLVQDAATIPLSTAEAFAELYELTKSELRVLLAMRPGRSLRQVAERLTISEPTARTHLQHIYAKTGTSKQSELLYLFMRFTPPIESQESQQVPRPMRLQ
jgi:DNA-binding CsgD family transcriptional regulator